MIQLRRHISTASLLMLIAGAASAGTPVQIKTCQTLKSNTTYSLTQDVVSVGTACFDFSKVSNIILNCNGHKISTAGSANVTLENSSNITLNTCNLQPESYTGGIDYIIGSNISGFTLENSTVGSPTYNVYQSIQLVVADKTKIINSPSLNAAVQIYYGTNLEVSYNKITAGSANPASEAFYPIELHYGNNNYVQYNTIEGRHDPTVYNSGSDDGIIVYDEDHDHISYNKIQNTYDAGIELVGVTTALYLHDNTILNTTLAGIGAYYWTSISGSTFANNTATNTNYLFDIFRTGGLRAAGYDYPLQKKPADSGVYFENNVFTNNKLISPSFYDDHFPSYIPVFAQMGYTDSPAIPGADFHIGNNTFQDNNFTHVDQAPDFGESSSLYKYVSGYIVDHGGNICTKTYATYPLACN